MTKKFKCLETKLIHAGEPDPRIQGAVVLPIFQSAMFEYAGEANYHDLKYIRLNNTPNHIALHQKLASLEGAEAALVTSSGMAAISATLLSILSVGDHLLVQNSLYGGTHVFITEGFSSLGLTFDFIDADDSDSWAAKLLPSTRAIYVETSTNPLLQIGDHQAVVKFAKTNDLVSIIDNTLASPINFRPLEWGFDLSLHSCTKYLNGHSDVVAGAVIGRSHLVDQIKRKLDLLGGCLDPHAAFLLHRGMKTLAVRVKCQNESALVIARFLEEHPAVARVNYPGLPSHPQHERARELFDGFGGMLSFELHEGVLGAERLLQNLRIPVVAPSLGDVETLITRPATTSHAGMAAEDRCRRGISDSLIRVSVGIEATEELIDDFRQALGGVGSPVSS